MDIALFPYFHSPDMSCVVILQTILIAVCVSKEYQEEVKNVLILKLIFAKYSINFDYRIIIIREIDFIFEVFKRSPYFNRSAHLPDACVA